MRLIQKSLGLYLAEGDIYAISNKDINLLKSAIKTAPYGRVRINLHPSSEDTLHEMFIAIQKDSYIRAHKHPKKSESFHIVEGSAWVIIFNDEGSIKQTIKLAANCPATPFYYRMSKPYYHTLIIESDILIMHEITNGPFLAGETLFAPFAPEENNIEAAHIFQQKIVNQLHCTSI